MGTGERLIVYVKGDFRRAGGNNGVTIWMEVRDPITNILEDPGTTYACTLKDSEGTAAINAAAMTKSSTGIYYSHYNYAADSPLGTWWGWVNSVNDTDKNAKYFNFVLEE